MKLSELVEEYTVIDNNEDIEIESLSSHTDNTSKNSIFFALDGTMQDGKEYIQQAIKLGAVAVVTNKFSSNCNVPQIIVDNTRIAMSDIAYKFFNKLCNNRLKSLKLVGITGTNGKTTTTYMLKAIFKANTTKCAIFGTNGIWIDNEFITSNLTTPDPIELFSFLVKCITKGIEYVVMEVSAHAVHFDKIRNLNFSVIAFTNFSQDHLDFFGSLENYKNAKVKLFTNKYAQIAVVNTDDVVGQDIVKNIDIPVVTYGYNQPCDVFALDLNMGIYGNKYLLNYLDDLHKVRCCLPGKFNMYNSLCAITISKQLGLPMRSIIKGLKNIDRVDGRFNIINTANYSIIIDFAHSEDGILNILRTIKEFAPSKIITVFGCGGNRDANKRPKMGKAVTQFSDYTVITSDNPRLENPNIIIEQIKSGIDKDKLSSVTTISDRKLAIETAISMAQKDDIILIAGKGAEKYQDIMGEKKPYNDEDYVKSIINN